LFRKQERKRGARESQVKLWEGLSYTLEKEEGGGKRSEKGRDALPFLKGRDGRG